MKALKLLAVAAVATLVFAGCQKTTEMDVNLETGMANYDVTGKTFVNVDTNYITMTVNVVTQNFTAGTTTTASTVTKIASQTVTQTMVFNADGTYTYTSETAYAAGADGDYRDNETQTWNADKTVVTTTTTSYSGTYTWDALISGLSGVATSTTTQSGTYKAFWIVDSTVDGKTIDYTITPTSSVTATTSVNGKYTAVPAKYTYTDYLGFTQTGSIRSYAYTTGDTSSTTNAIDSSDIDTLGYSYIGITETGKAMLRLNGDTYIEQ